MGLLLISHDLVIVENMVDRIAVLFAGRIVEEGPTPTVFSAPLHPYTRALLASAPGRHRRIDSKVKAQRPFDQSVPHKGCLFAGRCELAQETCRITEPALTEIGEDRKVRCPVVLSKSGEVKAVAGVSFRLDRAASLGIVGGSGSGKSTLARLLLALENPDRGAVQFDGQPVSKWPESRVRPLRKRFQAVFQDPSLSLNPCLRVGTIIAEPLAAHAIGNAADRRARVAELLDQVGMPAVAADRYPKAFSGGERQRIAIARALATSPELLILDEPVSSLDVSVQAQVLDLIAELQRQHELALVLISHDLEVVRDVCKSIAVMSDGVFVETGSTTEILENPSHRYTRALLDAAPRNAN
jgi:peptide/nickel transport system ATP-binding protein